MKIKIFGILTAAAMTFSLFGCGSDSDKKSKSKNESGSENKTSSYSTVLDPKELDTYDSGFYRVEKSFKTGIDGTKYFGLNGMDVSTPSASGNTARTLEGMGYPAAWGEGDEWNSLYFQGNPVNDSLLGIKYIMDNYVMGDANAHRMADGMYGDSVFHYEYAYDDKTYARVEGYKNPNALSLGYMADDTVRRISMLGNDNAFESTNIYMSTLSGSTVISNMTFSDYTHYFTPLNVDKDDFILNNVTSAPYGYQTQYVADTGNDPYIGIRVTPVQDGPVYMYFQTEFHKASKLWLSTEKDKKGNYTNHKFLYDYYLYGIVNLGDMKAGEEFELKMTIEEDFLIVNTLNFCQLDRELFQNDIDMLKEQQWDITSATEKSIEGTIEAKENQLMVTSIPYDENWTVTVDGTEIYFCDKDKDKDEFDSTEQCWTKIIEEFIAVKLTPGEHTVKMTYNGNGGAPLRLFTY